MTLVGIDEVGRGCWAGPLLAAAVILDPTRTIEGLDDSKVLSRVQRVRLDILIRQNALAIGIGWVWPQAIDNSGVTAAVKQAMFFAVQDIKIPYDRILIDGNYNYLKDFASILSKVDTMVRADGTVPAVSAASIIAKVARDRYMTEVVAIKYPLYDFDRHVGYGTAAHRIAMQSYGVTEIHRRSFKPVAAQL